MSSAASQAPNTGRILDLWLGGTDHLPADAGAAAGFDALLEGRARSIWAVHRAYIGRVVQDLHGRGIERFLVFGAGVPTRGNVHEHVPGARVLYSDIDETNVELGQEILDGHARVGYTHCDFSDVSTLDAAVVEEVLGVGGPIGLVAIGVNAFLEDDELRGTLDQLYSWVPAGSALALDFDAADIGFARYPAVLEMLEAAGEPLRTRTPERIRSLLGRWELSDEGIRSVATWGLGDTAEPEEIFMYGCAAWKR